MGPSIKPPENIEVKNDKQHCEEHQDNVESPRAIPEIDKPKDSNGEPLNQRLAYYKLINAEAMLQSNSTLQNGKVVVMSMIIEGVIVLSCDENPTLKYIACDFKFYEG